MSTRHQISSKVLCPEILEVFCSTLGNSASAHGHGHSTGSTFAAMQTIAAHYFRYFYHHESATMCICKPIGVSDIQTTKMTCLESPISTPCPIAFGASRILKSLTKPETGGGIFYFLVDPVEPSAQCQGGSGCCSSSMLARCVLSYSPQCLESLTCCYFHSVCQN